VAYWFDISRTRSAMVRALYAYWDGKRGAEPMPRRQDIDPAEIKMLLPYLLIADLIGEKPRVLYRLVGTKVAVATGLDFTGRYLDEFVPNDVEKLWHEYYRIARDQRLPVLGDAAIPIADGGRFVYEFGIFPLRADGARTTQCLAIEDYGKVNDRLAELLEKTRPSWQRQGPAD
jgi:hypothetical protein